VASFSGGNERGVAAPKEPCKYLKKRKKPETHLPFYLEKEREWFSGKEKGNARGRWKKDRYALPNLMEKRGPEGHSPIPVLEGNHAKTTRKRKGHGGWFGGKKGEERYYGVKI